MLRCDQIIITDTGLRRAYQCDQEAVATVTYRKHARGGDDPWASWNRTLHFCTVHLDDFLMRTDTKRMDVSFTVSHH